MNLFSCIHYRKHTNFSGLLAHKIIDTYRIWKEYELGADNTSVHIFESVITKLLVNNIRRLKLQQLVFKKVFSCCAVVNYQADHKMDRSEPTHDLMKLCLKLAKYTDKRKNIAFTMTNQAFAVRPEQNFKVRYLCGKHRSKGKVFAILTKINDNLTVRSSRQTLVSNWFLKDVLFPKLVKKL